MGAEFFLLLLLGILGVGAFIFFTGSFGVAKATIDDETDEERPTHVYVEKETKERFFGADSTEHVRRRAEEDPDTEVRA
ncbi:MAG: hypothetical protein ACRDSN_03760 [Pseudonocardiaceae bacterium]